MHPTMRTQRAEQTAMYPVMRTRQAEEIAGMASSRVSTPTLDTMWEWRIRCCGYYPEFPAFRRKAIVIPTLAQ